MKILMVCLGNICRSPMAEGIMRDLVAESALSIEIDSAGTSDQHAGEAPDKRAVASMKKHGHDIRDLRARQFTASDFDQFDHIFAMDDSNMRNIMRLARNETDRSKVRLYLSSPGAPTQLREVPDPYYGGDQGFENVYQMLKESSIGWLQMWQSNEQG